MIYPDGASSSFDVYVSKKYKEYKQQVVLINKRLAEINKNRPQEKHIKMTPKEKEELSSLFEQRKKLESEIRSLIPFHSDMFREYAQNMMNVVECAILKDIFLSECTINWDKIDIESKTKYGALLLSKIADKYKETDATIDFYMENAPQDEYDQNAAGYDWNGGIHFRSYEFYINDLKDFIGVLLHEFIHYLSDKHPGKSFLGAQFSFISARHYLNFLCGPQNQEQFDAYKSQPFERASYEIQDFIKDSGFIEKLCQKIIANKVLINSNTVNR